VTTATLYGLCYSPWTERARWALDHHRVAHRYREHVPYLGEPVLRWRSQPPPGARATVPLFVDAHGAHRDSIDIVVHADRVGSGPQLVRDEAALRRLAEIAETGLRSIRARFTSRLLADPEALRESAMAAVPAPLATLAAPIAAAGARFVAAKYGASLGREDDDLDVMRTTAHALATHVDLGAVPTRATLRAEDLVVATFLAGVRPADVAHISLRPAIRRAWTAEPLTGELAPLLAWRDALYASARGDVSR
jgi:glutathione S-transferase